MGVGGVEITQRMARAGMYALGKWYGEPGEPKAWARRCVEEVYEAMEDARGEVESDPSAPASDALG